MPCLSVPQGKERIRGKADITAFRTAYPASLSFEMRRETNDREDLWVNEYVIRYDGVPRNVIGVMEFRDGKVFRETIYIGDPWEPPAWRARMGRAHDGLNGLEHLQRWHRGEARRCRPGCRDKPGRDAFLGRVSGGQGGDHDLA